MSELFSGQVITSQGPASTDQSAVCGSCIPDSGLHTFPPVAGVPVRESVSDGSNKIESLMVAERPSKHRYWYNQIIEAARCRDIPTCYTEVHHIKPRSMGGGNEPENLVRLTYREHFLVHWLLTRFCIGGDLRRMQRALFAMSLQKDGRRIVAGWQFDLAKRAIRDLELDPALEARWLEEYHAAKAERARQSAISVMQKKARQRHEAARIHIPEKAKAQQLSEIASKLLSARKRPKRTNTPYAPLFDPSLPRSERLRLAADIEASAIKGLI